MEEKMKKLSKSEVEYALSFGIHEEDLENIWLRVSYQRMQRFGLSEELAEKDADEVINSILDLPYDDEVICLDPEIGSLLGYYLNDGFVLMMNKDEIKSMEEHIPICELCSLNIKSKELSVTENSEIVN
jgi:hypothetical protein